VAKKPAASAAKTKSGPAAATKPAAASTKKAAAPTKKQPKPAPKKADKPEVRKPQAAAPAGKTKAEAPTKKADKPKPEAKKPAAAPAPSPKAKAETPAKPAVAPKPAPGKPTGAKPPVTTKAPPAKAGDSPAGAKSAPSKPAAKGGSSKDAKKGAAPLPNQPRFKIPFAGSIVDEKAAAAKLTAAAGLSHVKKMRSDIHVRDENAPRLKKSPLSKKQLQEFKDDLLARRTQIVNTLQSVESEALFGGSGSLSHTPQHMADAGSDTYDQSLALDIAGHQRTSLRDIDAALQRIEDNTYGICEVFGTPIDLERLKSQPWTKYSIEGAREFERTSYQR